ncbi:NAD-dependent epimerase/dehydratase family protein [Dehalobacter sp. TeCB1]|uniref:GDP-mannose 4,6-dehydratase n=1 Tax=Dehalobacter sp. TeCB1 TaxID=1843715 RepID=UPI00083B99BF|nr:NAD-dependent epimerase/dehydratase family protein [Dehalobacter sp. TeCB1]OCZ49453.1 epimerase [Dehalobacter sp. TeCB1]
MDTIIVTGGAGFIGSHLCERLFYDGWRVINVDNFNDFYDPLIKRRNAADCKEFLVRNGLSGDKYIVADGDICDMIFLRDIFKKFLPLAVIHLAAYAGVRPSIQRPELYVQVNINGTTNVLECMKEFGVKYHVFASSSSVYGNNLKVPFAEDDFVDKPISPYAATKKAGELLCHTYHHLYDINTACLRFFTVYGPRQRPDLAIHKFTQLIMEGKPIPFYGNGTTQRDYTYIDDIIDGIVRALDWVRNGEKRYEIFNLGESKTISLSEMVNTLETALNRKAELEMLPSQPGDVERTYADISKSKIMLDYNPTTEFTEGIAKFIKWYRRRNYR